MCSGCWHHHGAPTYGGDDRDAVALAIDDLYAMEGCSVGGPLHIVTEDMNLARHHIEWCLDELKEKPDDWPEDVTVLASRICRWLLARPKGQRYAILAKQHGYLDA